MFLCIYTVIKTPANDNQEEIFNKKEKEIEKLLITYNATRSINDFLQSLVNITQNSTFESDEITKRSCSQFQLLLEDWQTNVFKVFKENSKIPSNNSSIAFIEFIDFNWKLKRLISDKTVEYQEWTTTVRTAAYGTATGITVGMIIADIFGCLGMFEKPYSSLSNKRAARFILF